MKNSILIFALFLISFSFAQENLKTNMFKTSIEENHFKENNYDLFKLEKIMAFEFVESISNSEGKFPVFLLSNKNTKTILEKEENTKKLSIKNLQISVIESKDFVNEIIIKKIVKNKVLEAIALNRYENYGDRSVLLYKDQAQLLDNLNYTFYKDEYIDIQLGQNIYRHIKKLYKNEIDKTLQSSLNLLAINF